MPRNILESDEIDSKIFAGRVLSLLGEIIQEQQNQRRFLEEKFFFPTEDAPTTRTQMDDGVDEDEEYDDEELDV